MGFSFKRVADNMKDLIPKAKPQFQTYEVKAKPKCMFGHDLEGKPAKVLRSKTSGAIYFLCEPCDVTLKAFFEVEGIRGF